MLSGRKLAHAFSPEQRSKLSRHGITSCKEFLSADVLELMSVLSLSYYQLLPLTRAVSQAVVPRPRNVGLGTAVVLELYRAACSCAAGRGGFISTSLRGLDAALHGGLARGTITEIAGPPGCGKTQLCVSLTVATTEPTEWGGCGLGVVYIDTEATFSAERLVEVARARHPAQLTDPDAITQLASRVKVHQALTSGDLERTLAGLEEELAELGKGAGLVLVDSIASPVRREFDMERGREAVGRSAVLGRLTARLKYLAEAFNIAVVVTNQITTTGISHDLERESNWSELGDSHVTAALGNTWAHCVNTRLLLGHLPQPHRMLTIAKSPVSACKSYVITLEERGVALNTTATERLEREPPGLGMALQTRSDMDTSTRVL